LQSFSAFDFVSRGLHKIQIRHFGIDDDEPVAGQADEEVRLAITGPDLLAEIAMGAHAGGFDYAAQGFLTPTSPGLARTEHAAQLQGFAGEGLALERQSFEMFLDFAEGFGLDGFAVLQSFLVSLKLFFERLDERFK